MRKVLITDFDGTLTDVDFYQWLRQGWLPADTPDYWQQYLQGEVSHFEALQRYFAYLRAPQPQLEQGLAQLGFDPQAPSWWRRLEAAHWQIVVVSAGCDWYI